MPVTRHILSASFLAATAGFAAPAHAQKVEAFAGNSQRDFTQVIYYTSSESGFSFKGAVSIHYGAPDWKSEYAELINQPNTRHRLGKDGWTTLDTNVSLQVGNLTIAPGTYYLALEVTKKLGVCNLILLDADKIRAAKALPNISSEIKGGIAVPLETEQPADDEHVAKLRLTLSADEQDASKTQLEIRWGSLMMTAKLRAKLDQAD